MPAITIRLVRSVFTRLELTPKEFFIFCRLFTGESYLVNSTAAFAEFSPDAV